jgi:hypothetical protein
MKRTDTQVQITMLHKSIDPREPSPSSLLLDLLDLGLVHLLGILERRNLPLIRSRAGRRPHTRTLGHVEHGRRLLGRELLGFREREEDGDKVKDEDTDVDRVTSGAQGCQ